MHWLAGAAHVVQQQVRVGENRLLREHFNGRRVRQQSVQIHCAQKTAGRGAGGVAVLVAGAASRFKESRSAALHVLVPGGARLVEAAPLRHRQQAQVELHQRQLHIGNVHIARMRILLLQRRLLATDLPLGAGLLRREPIGDAHVSPVGVDGLLQQGRRAALGTEPAKAHGLCGGVKNAADAPADAVAVRIVRVGQAADVGLRHRLQQAEADELGRHPGGELNAVGEVAVAQLPHLDDRAAQLKGFAVLIGAFDQLVFDEGEAFAYGLAGPLAKGGKAGA